MGGSSGRQHTNTFKDYTVQDSGAYTLKVSWHNEADRFAARNSTNVPNWNLLVEFAQRDFPTLRASTRMRD